jgi:AcrR family transcriptional regulator
MSNGGRPRRFDRDIALRQAMELFWRHGYEGTSIHDLTATMGITATSLYAAFRSKEALFREAVAAYAASEGEAPHRALWEAPTAREGVEAMLRVYARAYTDPATPPGCMIVLSASTGSPSTRPVQDCLVQARQQTVADLRQRLDRGVARGDLPPGTDTAAIAAYYVALRQGLSIQARDGAHHADLDRIVDCAMAAWQPLTSQTSRPPTRRRRRTSPRQARSLDEDPPNSTI